MKTRSALTALVSRDLLLTYRQIVDLMNPLLFFLLFVVLFPLALSPDSRLLHDNAAGLIWMSATLSMLLSLDQLFKNDYEDGSLNLILTSPLSLPLLVGTKIIIYWLVNILPLILISPLMALLFHFSLHEFLVLLTSLLLGTPLLTLIGALGAALTIGLRQNNLLLSFLLLPLYVPVLIFGTGAVSNAANQLAFKGQLACLGAMLIIGVVTLPFAIAAALKMCNE